MTRRLIKSGSRFEDIASFSRVVVDNDMIYLSGTTGHYHEAGGFPDGAAAPVKLLRIRLGATI